MGRGIPFGEYRLLRRLGSGGMAEVFLAKREGPGGFEKQLVIKRILPHLAASERFTSMFLKEARLAALVDHPNLVHVSSFGEIDGEYYLAMEYVDGCTLADFLQRTGVLSPGVAARIVVDVLEALYAIHTAKNEDGAPMALVHRDVTPRNVMITRAGAVKLLDFGIAMTAEDEGLSSMGTRRYMAPEQYDGTGIDHRADLFGAGVLLYLTISGSLPFAGRPVERAKRHKRIPDGVWKALGPALELHAADRPADARAMQQPLELFVASRGIEGTRAHLAELASALTPSPAARALSRLTQIGALTRKTGTGVEGTSDTPPSRRRAAVAVGGLIVAAGLGAGVFYAASGPDDAVAMHTPELHPVANAAAESDATDADLEGADAPALPEDPLPEGDATAFARDDDGAPPDGEAPAVAARGVARNGEPGRDDARDADGAREGATAQVGEDTREPRVGAAGTRGGVKDDARHAGAVGSRSASQDDARHADAAGTRRGAKDDARHASAAGTRGDARGAGTARTPGAQGGDGSADRSPDAIDGARGGDGSADRSPDANDDARDEAKDGAQVGSAARAKRTKSGRRTRTDDDAPRKSTRKARTGELTIDTTPWSVVYLGDRKLGMTPLQGVKLPSGKHRLRLSNPDRGTEETIVVTIRAGRVTRVRRTL